MPPHTNDDTHARRQRVFLLIKQHSDGLRESEIAEMLQIQRRSINNYLTDLEQEGKIYKDGALWLPQSFTPAVIRPLEVQAEEATVLYLAARMLVKQSDRRNEIAETVLLKLAHVLKADAGVGSHIEEAARELVGSSPPSSSPASTSLPKLYTRCGADRSAAVRQPRTFSSVSLPMYGSSCSASASSYQA